MLDDLTVVPRVGLKAHLTTLLWSMNSFQKPTHGLKFISFMTHPVL